MQSLFDRWRKAPISSGTPGRFIEDFAEMRLSNLAVVTGFYWPGHLAGAPTQADSTQTCPKSRSLNMLRCITGRDD